MFEDNAVYSCLRSYGPHSLVALPTKPQHLRGLRFESRCRHQTQAPATAAGINLGGREGAAADGGRRAAILCSGRHLKHTRTLAQPPGPPDPSVWAECSGTRIHDPIRVRVCACVCACERDLIIRGI